MRDHRNKQNLVSTIFQHEWAKQGTCPLLEIVRQLYLTADLAEINLQAELPKLAPNKAFHSLAHGGEGIQGWQGNRGSRSIRAIVISVPNDPVTSLFSGAISSLESQLGFWERPSRGKTVMRTPKKTVFAYTQRNDDLACRTAQCVG
jgi:hypothetical protein